MLLLLRILSSRNDLRNGYILHIDTEHISED